VAHSLAMSRLRFVLPLVLVLVLGACTGGAATKEAAAPAPVSYLAVGASETVGVGADDPAAQAWPKVLFGTLPAGSTYTNVGVSGSTVSEALATQAPEVDRVKPDLATVWLNVNDALRLVPPATYEQQLRDLVHRLRRGGATKVLVANTPDVSELPIVKACLTPTPPAGSPPCPVPAAFRGPTVLAYVTSTVDSYNAAIARVVQSEGAVLVDLHAAILASRAAGIEATLSSSDGFHPSTAGHAAVAAEFAKALAASGGP
jgi:acyl-CoA thioesterase-1